MGWSGGTKLKRARKTGVVRRVDAGACRRRAATRGKVYTAA